MKSVQDNLVIKTLLISDLVGSTKLIEDLGDQVAAVLSRRHDRLARDLLQTHDGREIDKTDGFLLLFERPLNAVLYALAYHEALRQMSEEIGREIRARVGIHLGEITLFENSPEDVERGAKPLEVEGLAKPMAARLMSLAQGEQTLLTRGAFDLARRGSVGQLDAQDVGWLSHGDYRFKGVDEAVEVYEVGRKGHAPLSPPPESDKARWAAEQPSIAGWRPAPGLSVPHRSNWVVEKRLGEGGFGEVWLGVHRRTHDRRVFKFCYDAVRLQSLQREITLFLLLKEELGERDDIARILDWNFDEAPYFIESEYTASGNLAEWLEEQGGAGEVELALRLEIVARIAVALAAAHSVGVLHKDVKPANVLITDGPGTVRPQLTDFGVGLVVDHERLEAAGITVVGGMTQVSQVVPTDGSTPIGTWLYMAPELLESKRPTLQTDIYALGVMIYQLVVGDLSRALAPGWRRDIDDELLEEDIACFVDGSPDRRPASALEVAERLRGLEARRAERAARQREREEAEAARRTLEQAQRRRKLYAVMAAVATGVLLIVAVFAFTTFEARREEKKARKSAEQVLDFMVDLFEVVDPLGTSDPGQSRGENITTREILDRGAGKVEEEFEEDPLVRARIMSTLGRIYMGLGAFDQAELLFERALEVRREKQTGEDLDLARSLSGLAEVLYYKGQYVDSEEQIRQALALQRRLPGVEPLEIAQNLNYLGILLWSMGRTDEAERHLEEALAIRLSQLGEGHLEVAESQIILGVVLQVKGRYEEAEQLMRRALETRRLQLEENHTLVALSLQFLALLLQDLDNYEEATRLLRETVTIERSQLGEKHPLVGGALTYLAENLAALGQTDEAEDLLVQALEIFHETLPADHWWFSRVESLRGFCSARSGRYVEAESLLLESYPLIKARTGERSPFTRRALEYLVELYETWDKPEKAAEYRALLNEARATS